MYGTEVGEFCTSQEMKGVSVTLMRLDDELKELYDHALRFGFLQEGVDRVCRTMKALDLKFWVESLRQLCGLRRERDTPVRIRWRRWGR